MLWLLHHNNQKYSLDKLKNNLIWNSRKNIFLIDSEQHLPEDVSWHSDKRVHTWTPTVTNHARSYTYHFWFNWMQEIEKSLKYFNKIEHLNNKTYFFDALLGTPRTHKDIVKTLIDNSISKDKFMVSYNGNPLDPNCKYLMGVDEEHKLGSVLYNKVQVANSSCVIPYRIYNKCWYSLIAETSGNQPNFYTEKTAKPLLSQRLFVTFAGQHHLKHLNEFGFKTFDGIIDESYDQIKDIETRYQQAWTQIEFLLTQDPVQIYKQAKPILEHNHNHFMTTNWQKEMHEKIQNISQSSK